MRSHKEESLVNAPVFCIEEDSSEFCLSQSNIGKLLISSSIDTLVIEESFIDSISFLEKCSVEKLIIRQSTVNSKLDFRKIHSFKSLMISESSILSINLNGSNIDTLLVGKSQVSESILLTGSTISEFITIEDSKVVDKLMLDSVNVLTQKGFSFTGNCIGGDTDISDILVNGPMDFSNNSFQKLISDDLETRNGGFSLSSSVVMSNFFLRHATIDGIADFSGITVQGDTDMKYSKFNGLFDSSNSNWRGNLDISYYSREHSNQKEQFREGLYFDKTNIDGELIAYDIICNKDLLCIETNVTGKIHLINSVVSGIVVFQGSKFNSLTDLTGSRFHSCFLIDSSIFHSLVQDRLYCNDSAKILNSCVKDFFNSYKSSFISGLVIKNSEFKGVFNFSNTIFEKEISIEGNEFHNIFDFREVNTVKQLETFTIVDSKFYNTAFFSYSSIFAKKMLVKECFFGRKSLWDKCKLKVPEISFINIEFSSQVDFDDTTFVFPNCVSFIRVSSENILLTRHQLQNALYMAKSKGNAKEKARRHDRNADTYHWAKDVFSWNRRYGDQDWAIYHYLRESALNNFFSGFVKPFNLLKMLKSIFIDYLGIYLFWRLACGFGLKLRYMLGSSLLIIGLFGVLYSMNPSDIIISDEAYSTMVRDDAVDIGIEEAVSPDIYYQIAYTPSFKHSMKFSAAVFTSMTSGAVFMKIGSPIGLLVIIEGLLGVLFTTLFIGSAIRKVIRTV